VIADRLEFTPFAAAVTSAGTSLDGLT